MVEVLAVGAYVVLASDQLDLTIYRMGGQAVREGQDDLYRVVDPASGLVVTYPPFAAILFAGLTTIGEPAGFIALSLVSEPYVATLARGQINVILLWAVVEGMRGA